MAEILSDRSSAPWYSCLPFPKQMKNTQFPDNFIVDKNLPTPIYLQVVRAVVYAVKENVLKKGDKMPSINELSNHYQVTRSTIEKGYNELRDMGIMGSFQGKGFYINETDACPELKILLLFNKLSSYKKAIYDAFVETIGAEADTDLVIYNNNTEHFKRSLEEKAGLYSHYVILPHFIGDATSAYRLIDALPKNKLILLDHYVPGISGKFGAVYENFGADIFNALSGAKDRLKKYDTIKLIFPEQSYFPEKIVAGFTRFCKETGLNYQVLNTITPGKIRKGDAYIVIPDDQMMTLLNEISEQNLTPGKDVGVISYNENKSKKLIMNGITTISTDFRAMGVTAAQLVLTGSRMHVENPFYLTLRSSI
jgi:DNA-binding transcriptional regulator YhcF (GntR family)